MAALFKPMMVEFPPETNPRDPEIQRCARALGALGIHRSLYLSEREHGRCLTNTEHSNRECELSDALFIGEAAPFNSLSFDQSMADRVEARFSLPPHSLSTWSLSAEKIHSVEGDRRYRFVLFDARSDPNELD